MHKTESLFKIIQELEVHEKLTEDAGKVKRNLNEQGRKVFRSTSASCKAIRETSSALKH